MLNTLFLAALDKLLADAPWARDRLAPHRGRRVLLSVGPARVGFIIAADGRLSECDVGDDHEVGIMLPMPAVGELLALGLDPWIRQARINGHVETADALGFVFRNLRWDIEGDLAKWIGDIPAHRLHRTAIGLIDAQKRVLQATADNLRESLAEDRSPLLSQGGWAGRAETLRDLRDALARLEKRIARLER